MAKTIETIDGIKVVTTDNDGVPVSNLTRSGGDMVQDNAVALMQRTRPVETNVGSADTPHLVSLPAAAEGLVRPYSVDNANGLRLTAATGDVIYLGGKLGKSGGYLESTTPGSTVVLEGVAGRWYVRGLTGRWQLETS